MEYLVPVAIAAVGIGVLIFVLKRPSVAGPPAAAQSSEAESTSPRKPLVTIVSRGRTHTKSTVALFDGKTLSTKDVIDLAQGKGLDKLTQDLLKLMPDLQTGATPEARLAYPDSTMVLTTGETIKGGSAATEFRDAYKTTFATEADSVQVAAWYQDWLVAHGWQPNPTGATTLGAAREYGRGTEQFRLTFGDAAALRSVLAVPIPETAKTIFEIEYSRASGETPQT